MHPTLLPLLLSSSALVTAGDSPPAPRAPLDPGPVRALVLSPAEAARHAAGGAHRLTVKFTDAVAARATGEGALVSRTGSSLADAARVAARHGLRFAPLLALSEEELRTLEARAARHSGFAQPDLAGMMQIVGVPKDGASLVAIGEELRALPTVEYAYLELLGPPPPGDIAPTTPDLTAHQTYVPPNPGLDVSYAHGRGYRGAGVRFSDCEYGWNADHEDLNDIDLHLEAGQTIAPGVYSSGWDSHGTAVVGSANAVDNAYGITGIAVDSVVYTFPEWTNEEGFRRATCIAHAINRSAVGDVVLLEMQTTGAGGGYGPAELDPNVFAVVMVGTHAGVIVVGAAGNGNQDLDGPAYSSYRAMGDSGAILIGAGSANVGHDKLSFSTYGSRVNVQAWGTSVFTLGYGGFAEYGGDKNQRYTSSFNGTSSASGLSGPAAVVLQQAAIDLLGGPLSCTEMRQLLMDTGIPQGGGNHIGPCIDLEAALVRIDVMAHAAVRNGTGVNPLLYASTNRPVLGTTWTATVNASGHPGAGMTAIFGFAAPLPPTSTTLGELLVDSSSPLLLASWANPGGSVAVHANPVPSNAAFVGFRGYTQALVLGGFLELGNAIDLRLGY